MARDTFNKIAPEKRERVLREAAWLFAKGGYAHTDMAQLASKAQVSKGSLYDYFENKEDLYLQVCRYALERSRAAVYGDIDPDWDIHDQVAHIFRRGLEFAEAHPEYVAMYVNVSSAGMEQFADKVSLEVEQFTSAHLKELIRAGIEKGVVEPRIDVNLAAFLINSLYVMFMISLVSRHFRIRIKEYLAIDGDVDAAAIEQHLERTIELIQNILKTGGGNG